MADPSSQKGAEGTKMTSESAGGASHGGSSSISRPATPSTSKKVTQKIGSFFRKPFSKSKSRTPEPAPASNEIAQDQDPQAILPTAPDTLLVKTESIHFKENTVDPARKIAGYKLAIAVIDIFQPVVECTDIVLPNPVGMLLEQLSKALGVLKVGSVTVNTVTPLTLWHEANGGE
jgi:hypothetical protein